MNRHIMIGMAMLAGAALGAGAMRGLDAQAAGSPVPGAYAIIDISDVTDPGTFKQLLPKTEAPVAALDGRYLTRTENIVALDGTPPKRFVIVAFDSVETAKAWNSSASQKEVDALRQKSTRSRAFIVKADGAN